MDILGPWQGVQLKSRVEMISNQRKDVKVDMQDEIF